MGFMAHSTKDAKNMLFDSWKWDATPLFMKHYSPFFDARTKNRDFPPIWIKILGIPLDLWTFKVFKKIRGSIGIFPKMDTIFLDFKAMTVEKTLIGIDLREVLEA